MSHRFRAIALAAAVLVPAAASAGSLQANELGRVMILEYHKVDQPEERWTRTPANFRGDLERLWERGLYLPSSPRLDRASLEHVVDCLREAAGI